ncbi:MAG: winged helix-turn-helix domain-containing protein [Rhabdochlamydiaceae bacterium]
MWDLPKGDQFLPRVDLDKLEGLYSQEERTKPKLRLLCAIHRKKGESIDEIVEATNLKKTTVHDILHRFCNKGINGKDAIKQTGRPSFLTLRQRKGLVAYLEKRGPLRNKGGLWTTKEVREYIRKRYNVKYTHVHVWELLQVLGFSVQKPRPRHYKHSAKEEIDKFKKKLPGWHAIIERRVL